MREWLKSRRNALIDAALIYVAAEWLGPAVVSTVIYLGSSDSGLAVLLMIGYAVFLATVAILILKVGLPGPSSSSEEGEWVFVLGRKTYPFIGVQGSWVRVKPRQAQSSRGSSASISSAVPS